MAGTRTLTTMARLLLIRICTLLLTALSKAYFSSLVAAVDHVDSFPSPIRRCSLDEGGGICPFDNTCCPLPSNANSSGCIPSDLGARVATCCYDDYDSESRSNRSVTGCGVGYRCAIRNGNVTGDHSDHQFYFCRADPSQVPDPLVQLLPRYHLCQATSHSDFSIVRSLVLPLQSGHPHERRMPYYSSHGDLDRFLSSPNPTRGNIRMVLIVIHGANRNADDYFCSATAAVTLQNYSNLTVDQVFVLAPRFMVRSDFPNENLALQHLYWKDKPNGPWRYGADADTTDPISSFRVLDTFLQRIVHPGNLPQLERITLFGHSSGGQLVQRWAVLSPAADDHRLRVIVANPSSYVYLTPQRQAHNGTMVLNTSHQNLWQQSCPRYNHWEWGLETDDETPQYVQRVLQEYHSDNSSVQPYKKLIDRYAKRKVIYLIGSKDRCNVSSTMTTTTNNSTPVAAWCQSHDLETSCMDEVQGSSRWERHHRYLRSLCFVGIHSHRGVVVPGVAHDHSLMLMSPQGLQVLFRYDDNGQDANYCQSSLPF